VAFVLEQRLLAVGITDVKKKLDIFQS